MAKLEGRREHVGMRAVTSLAVLGGGRLASGSEDRTIAIWDSALQDVLGWMHFCWLLSIPICSGQTTCLLVTADSNDGNHAWFSSRPVNSERSAWDGLVNIFIVHSVFRTSNVSMSQISWIHQCQLPSLAVLTTCYLTEAAVYGFETSNNPDP